MQFVSLTFLLSCHCFYYTGQALQRLCEKMDAFISYTDKVNRFLEIVHAILYQGLSLLRQFARKCFKIQISIVLNLPKCLMYSCYWCTDNMKIQFNITVLGWTVLFASRKWIKSRLARLFSLTPSQHIYSVNSTSQRDGEWWMLVGGHYSKCMVCNASQIAPYSLYVRGVDGSEQSFSQSEWSECD